MVNKDEGNLRSSVFFVWGALCTAAFIYAYFLIPETKVRHHLHSLFKGAYKEVVDILLTRLQGLTLEQVDKMLEETTPRTSAKWRPHSTFANDLGMTTSTGGTKLNAELLSDVERKGSVF